MSKKDKTKAIKIIDEYDQYENNDKRQIMVWKFPKTKKQPLGIKYRFAFIHRKECILRYDNEILKGHHKHIYNKEIKIKFVNIKDLHKQFIKEVRQLRKKLLEDENES